MNGSLRLRLLVGTSFASAVILGLLGVAIYLSMGHTLLKEFDSALLTQANALASMAEQNGHKVKFESDYLQLPEFTRKDRPEYFEARLADGTLLAASPSLESRKLAASNGAGGGRAEFRDTVLPDGRRGRMIVLPFTPRSEREDEDRPASITDRPAQRAVLFLARDTHSMRETLEDLRLLLIGLCSSAIVVSGLILFAIVKAGPCGQCNPSARRIEVLRETDLGSRLPVDGAPTELRPVIEKLNGLLGRLQQVFAREKSFTADVAHELRTPISGIQTTLQVCQSRPREQAEYVAAIDKCLKMTGDMRGVIESLLLLARADAGQLVVESRPAELCGLIRECWNMFQSRAAERQIRSQINLPDHCQIDSDTDKLRIVLNNLLDNAVSYCDAGGTIQIDLRSRMNEQVIEFSNTGSRLVPEEAAKVFDRFWRADAARSQTGLHCPDWDCRCAADWQRCSAEIFPPTPRMAFLAFD